MHHFITGAAGFIGSQLADGLLGSGDRVSGLDDFSAGTPGNLAHARASENFRFFEGDCSNKNQAGEILAMAAAWGGKPDFIWHLAANSDIPNGVADASIDFNRTLLTTFACLEAAKAANVRNMILASTSAVYGERSDLLTEDSGPMLPISNYGASKLASEALLSAAAESFLEKIWIFRFPNVVGPRATHGVILDFIKRLRVDSTALTVLGDGTQAKPYLHVSELISAMRFAVAHARKRRNVINIGPQGANTRVAYIAQAVTARVSPAASIVYGKGDRGWVGDVPHFRYSVERLGELGWRPNLTSDQAVIRAIDEIAAENDC